MKSKLLVTVILLALTYIFTSCGGGPTTPQEVVKDTFKMMENNDKAGIKDVLSKQAKELLNDEKLEQGLNNKYNEIKAKNGISEIEFLKEDIKENEADFRVKLIYGDGSSKEEKVKLIKEDGDWKLGISK